MLENGISALYAPLTSIYVFVAQLLAHFSFPLKAPPLHCQWLTSSIQSILSAAWVPGHSFRISAATSAGSGGLPDHVIKTLGTWSIDAYQIYIHTPISTIVRVASLLTWHVFLAYLSLFLVVFVGCLGTLVVRGQGFPQPWAPLSLSDLAASARRVPSAWNGGSWLGCGDLPAMGAVFLSRGWLATVEAPGYPRHPPST